MALYIFGGHHQGSNSRLPSPFGICEIQTARNSLIFEGKTFSPEEISLKGLILTKEWTEAQGKSSEIKLLPSALRSSSNRSSRSTYTSRLITCWIFSRPSLAVSSQGSSIQTFVNSPRMVETVAFSLTIQRPSELKPANRSLKKSLESYTLDLLWVCDYLFLSSPSIVNSLADGVAKKALRSFLLV
ncbi:hypothetical protein IGI04_036210 [Brassica rapa subsp. trilocularis]|uniref:Uncharacterized protein n=1 Tax=Brassica rapa subsp. trilocularis TaxID=1813537 RepID=A0ABQ7LFN9_BRACM|nr:hypothetical protein IGI04_036210 [Brassica rapa subsp. trilocularis]